MLVIVVTVAVAAAGPQLLPLCSTHRHLLDKPGSGFSLSFQELLDFTSLGADLLAEITQGQYLRQLQGSRTALPKELR